MGFCHHHWFPHSKKTYECQTWEKNIISSSFMVSLMIIGPFWAILGDSDLTKGVKNLTFWNLTPLSVFPPKKIYLDKIWGEKTSIYQVLWCFWWFSDDFVGQWRHKRVQFLKAWNFDTTIISSPPKKHSKTISEDKNVILSGVMLFLMIFGPFEGSVTSE